MLSEPPPDPATISTAKASRSSPQRSGSSETSTPSERSRLDNRRFRTALAVSTLFLLLVAVGGSLFLLSR